MHVPYRLGNNCWERKSLNSQLHWQHNRISCLSGRGSLNERLISHCVLHSSRLSLSFLTKSHGNACLACQQFNAPAVCYHHTGDKRNTWAEKLREYPEFKQVLVLSAEGVAFWLEHGKPKILARRCRGIYPIFMQGL